MTTYVIREWDGFENRTKDKRPRGPMEWFSHPTNLVSRGRLRLIRLGDPGFRALVVFEALVALHADRPIDRRDGRLVNSDGTPIDTEDLAAAINISAQIIEESMVLLASERIGWLRAEADSDGTRTEPGPNREQTRTEHGPKVVPTGQDLTDRTEGTRAGARDPGAAAPEPPPPSSPTAEGKPERQKPEHPVLAEWVEEADRLGLTVAVNDRTDRAEADAIAAAEPDPERRRAVFREAHRKLKAFGFVRKDWQKWDRAATETTAKAKRAEESRKRFEGAPAPPPVSVDVAELSEKGRQFLAQRERVKARQAGTIEPVKQTPEEAIANLTRSESA